MFPGPTTPGGRSRKLLHFALIVLFASLTLTSCGSIKRSILSGAGSPSRSTATRGGAEGVEIQREPWIMWTPGRLLNGSAVRNKGLLDADATYEKGDAQKALKVYQELVRKKLTPEEREAAYVRIASLELSAGDAERALSSVSTYYGGNQSAVSRVDPAFSLILGYGYARVGNIQQSLAWFKRLDEQAAERPSLREAAAAGVRDVLHRASNENLESLGAEWSTSALVGPLLGEERKLRMRGLAPGATVEVQPAETGDQAPQATAMQSPLHRIGVLLPLTGEHAQLGTSTRNGIALALTDGVEKGTIQLLERDSSQGSAAIEEAVTSFAASEDADAVIGPLLSADAPVAAEAARRQGIPLLTFSKQASFQPGNGVFRLGTTARSQIVSLVETASGLAGLQRFAMVYPATPAGNEFADEFRRTLQQSGTQLVFDREYQPSDEKALMTMAEEVMGVEPDAIFCPDSISNAAHFFGNIPEPGRSRITPLGTAAWDEARQLKRVARPLDGALFPSIFFAESSDPSVKAFVDAYRVKHGAAPDLLAAQGFDAAALVSAAQRNAEAVGNIAAGMQSISSYLGLTGRMSVRQNGEIERFFRVLVLTKGGLSELSQNETAMRDLKRRKELFKKGDGDISGESTTYRSY